MNIDPQSLTVLGALVAGLITSIHCIGMCGPLACGLMALQKNENARLAAAIAYHGGRLLAYTTIAAACAGLGSQPLKWFFDSPAVFFPWAVGLVLLVIALTGNQFKIRIPGLSLFLAKLRLSAQRQAPWKSGLALGLTAPLLPCGPLYLLFAACLLAGTITNGAVFGLAFGLGTIPGLWLAHQSLARLQKKLGSHAMQWIRRSLALISALMIFARMGGTLTTSATAESPVSDSANQIDQKQENPKLETGLPKCPMCDQ